MPLAYSDVLGHEFKGVAEVGGTQTNERGRDPGVNEIWLNSMALLG